VTCKESVLRGLKVRTGYDAESLQALRVGFGLNWRDEKERKKTRGRASYKVMQNLPRTGLARCAHFPDADVSVS
jgi:hypothetical protein